MYKEIYLLYSQCYNFMLAYYICFPYIFQTLDSTMNVSQQDGVYPLDDSCSPSGNLEMKVCAQT